MEATSDIITSTILEVGMDANYISYESLLAARDAAQWAYWSMWIAFASSVFTFFALVVGYMSIISWRSQEVLKDRKVFALSVLKYQKIIGLGPSTYSLNAPSEQFDILTNTIIEIYENALLMTNKKDRQNALRIYLSLSDIYDSLHQGRVNANEALNEILKIRGDSFLSDF